MKRVTRTRRSLKKTFSKKRNQRKAFYIGSFIVIASLIFGIGVTEVHAINTQNRLVHQTQQIRIEKQNKITSLSKALETITQAKAVTDTQLEQKTAKQAEMQSQIDKLQSDLQAKLDRAKIASYVGYGGGSYQASYTDSNGYAYGNCTWYVKNRRPDLPNNLGNANTWYSRAASMGIGVGTIPKTGAVGATTTGSLGHVVYIESVNVDGSVNVTEMNYVGFNQTSGRTVSASSFVYIY